MNKKDISIFIGNCFEHYDTALYGFLAPVLSRIFFPNKDPYISLAFTYLGFATGFIFKPVGSILFGIYARKKGPVEALSKSLYGTAFFTTIIAFLPNYKTIGIFSPIFLILIKSIRSIFIAGETSISKLYVLENKSEKKAFKTSIFYQASTMIGIILASLLVSLIIFLNVKYLWRICYLLGGITAIVGMYLRNLESNDENIIKNKSIKKISLITFWQNKYNILKIAFVNGFSYVTYIIPFVVLSSFLPLITNISNLKMLATNNLLLVIDFILIMSLSKFIINYNHKKVMILSISVFIITLIPFWFFIKSSFYFVCFFRFWIVFWGIVYLCPLNLWKYSIVKNLDDDKYLIVGFASNLGAILIGKSLSPLCFYLYYLTNNYLIFPIYVTIICLLTLFFIYQKKI